VKGGLALDTAAGWLAVVMNSDQVMIGHPSRLRGGTIVDGAVHLSSRRKRGGILENQAQKRQRNSQVLYVSSLRHMSRDHTPGI
jgi:hypothetical protein